MHQTFYIDIDEEISSVIDRLNKSMAEDNYFVAPSRAIFLQSIVNLKLLRREADKAKKRVFLVTQDEIGISMAHRAGIEIRPTTEGLEPVAGIYPEDPGKEEYLLQDEELVEPQKKAHKSEDKQVRLDNLGSRDFYELPADPQKKEPSFKSAKPISRKIPVNSSSRAPEAKRKMDNVIYADISPREIVQAKVYKRDQSAQDNYRRERGRRLGNDIFSKELPPEKRMDSRREKTLEKFFSFSKKPQDRPAEDSKNNFKSKEIKSRKVFLGFGLLCLFALALVAAYLLVPSVKISITPDATKNNLDISVHVSGSAKAEGSNIPVRTLDQTQDISATYKVTGSSLAGGKKAHGNVVIYNEYNSAPQTLVATTRLESPDGKIFRLTKNVVVPGTTVVGGSLQPGAIEAEIIADQAGSDFNIDPAKFTIPGFSGSLKFDKFYAKSTAPLTGGSSENGNGIAMVSQQDINDAKTKTEAALKDAISETIKNELKQGEMALAQAEKMTIIKSATSARAGDAVDSFNYTAQASVRALIFSEDDIKNILEKASADAQPSQDARQEISKIEYLNVNPDFDNSAMDLKVHSEVTIIPNIDLQQIKKELLGKNADQVADILKKYPAVKNANLEFWPTFISRISPYPQRVSVEIVSGG